jgi:hypothetical protein
MSVPLLSSVLFNIFVQRLNLRVYYLPYDFEQNRPKVLYTLTQSVLPPPYADIEYEPTPKVSTVLRRIQVRGKRWHRVWRFP